MVGEIIGAVVGNSWSLLGDAAAMSIDVVTYGTNMIAERIKSKSRRRADPEDTDDTGGFDSSISVSSLIGVTIYVTVGAVNDIITPPEDDDVNIFFVVFESQCAC